ncbi:MAG: hypothetical protein K6F69_05555 [Treponema sp.]|nr:hypothetical protein [Treponema sp.]
MAIFRLSASDIYFYPGINLDVAFSYIKDEDLSEDDDVFYTSFGIDAGIAAELNISIDSLFLGGYYKFGVFDSSRVNKKQEKTISYSGFYQEYSLGIGLIEEDSENGTNGAFMLYPLIFRNGFAYDGEECDSFINWWKSGIQCSYSIFMVGININWVTSIEGDFSFDLFPDYYLGIRYSPFFL